MRSSFGALPGAFCYRSVGAGEAAELRQATVCFINLARRAVISDFTEFRSAARGHPNPGTLEFGSSMPRDQERPLWGNLRRTTPFSDHYGFDRGTPVDRYYVARFMEANRACITGQVLEIQSAAYTQAYGHDVRTSHTVDIDPSHGTDFVCDLARSEGKLARAAYNCFLMPNTLNHLRDLKPCLREALRVVKSGGTILTTVATLVPLTPDFNEYWRFAPAAWEMIAAEVWPGCEIAISSIGNVLAATAAMLGLAAEELSPEELDDHDPRYPVLIAIRCRKP